MSLDSALYGLVTGDGTISGLISTRFWPATAQQESTKPYIVYQRLSTPRRYFEAAQSGLSSPRYQLTSIATTFDGARALADALRSLLSGYSGTTGGVVIHAIFLDNERDDFADAINEFAVRQDFIIWHTEA